MVYHGRSVGYHRAVTWYAHHVYAGPPALAPLAAGFPGHVYRVFDLDNYRRARREVFAREIRADGTGRNLEREVLEGPALAEGGLVVVRELAEPDSHAFGWFGDDARSWHGDGAPDPAVLAVDVDPAPPAPLLGLLRRLARDADTVVSLVCAATWGGDLEYAFAWVFDGWGDRVYARDADGVVRAWSSAGARVIVEGDVVTLAMLHHGFLLDGGYFELHTRRFPWSEHRVPA